MSSAILASERITATVYVFVPDRADTLLGKSETILTETDRDAQERAAEIWHGIPGAIYRTDKTYPAERYSDGWVRALTEGRHTLAEDIERSGRCPSSAT